MIESCSGPFSYRDLIWNRKIFLSHWGVLHRGKELGNEKNHCNGTEEYYTGMLRMWINTQRNSAMPC